jgi:hypothetical protein
MQKPNDMKTTHVVNEDKESESNDWNVHAPYYIQLHNYQMTDSNEGVKFKRSKTRLILYGAGPEQTAGIHFWYLNIKTHRVSSCFVSNEGIFKPVTD